MRRRQFIAGLGSAAAWPMAARAQRGERVRRVGVLMGYDESDPEGKARLSGFTQGLTELGWTEGRNVRMEVRWAADNVDRVRALAKELVDLKPDVILASNTPTTAALQRETRMIPIVFSAVSDPVGEGFIANISHPGGNITGVATIEASLTGKWLQLLTEIAPGVKRAAIPQFPNKTRSTLTRDRFCGPEHPGTSHLRVVYHLVGFFGTHGESGHDRVQSARVGLA